MKTELFQIQSETEMPVFSMWQPWASWVMLGWKTIETRLHARFAGLAGLRTGIHAARYWDAEGLALAIPWLTDEQVKLTLSWWRNEAASGALLGTVQVTGHRRLGAQDSAAALIECVTPRFGLVLEGPVGFETPIPMKGRQGIWYHRFESKQPQPD